MLQIIATFPLKLKMVKLTWYLLLVLTEKVRAREVNTLKSQATPPYQETFREEIGEYVAQLQLHMSLQARNLVPTLTKRSIDSREQLLHETQANIEKLISRQTL